ncbi:MAG: hypothetical protein IH986_01705 [Planctomycetes bacterium]|nr:hypothetical protein [Planctomycetota bacterium]
MAACVAPVLVLAGAWWAVNVFVLAPRVPGASAEAAESVHFIAHPKGLPRLGPAETTRFLREQIGRLLGETSFREAFTGALRRLASDEQTNFRAHVFGAFKPLVMSHIERFHALDAGQRRDYLDDRIVEYNRMTALLRTVQVEKSALSNTMTDPSGLMKLLLAKTTAKERERGATYLAAIGKRIEAILADPQLEQAIRDRIDAPP